MERHRIDHWLKLVCLFKHREEAAEACRGGHVKVNGQRARPGAALKEGDLVEFLHNDRFRRVVVSGLPVKPVSKETARTMYVDESPVPEKQVADVAAFRNRGAGRPTKRDRRELDNLRRR